MNAKRALAILAILTATGTGSLLAQRRGTDGGGSNGRGTPSGGSRGSSNGDRGRSSSGSGHSSGSDGSSSGSSTSSNETKHSGKIGAIARAAARDEARARRRVILSGGVIMGTCWDCNYWGYYGDRWGWYHRGWWYPSRYRHRAGDERDNGYYQGYEDYPYATTDSSASTFVEPRTNRRHVFGAVSGQLFSDAGSPTMAGRFGLEGAMGLLRGEVEYSYYGEPVGGRVNDVMQTYRFAVGVQPRLGNHAYLVAAIGGRALAINGVHTAGGPEGELGIQLLPKRPFGLNVTGRLAELTWNGQDYFSLRELNTTGSIFIHRVELQGGWHWLKVAGSPAFGGPVAGLRIWF